MTEKLRIEEALKTSEIRYRRLFESAQDGILILNGVSGSIDDVNPYLLGLLGYSYDEFIGKMLWELGAFKDINANKDRFNSLVENDYIQYNDLPMKTKGGNVIAVEFVSNVYMVGTVKTIQCNIRDITLRKKAEKELRESEKKFEEHIRQTQKLVSLSALAASVAHEFNNVFSLILISAETIAVGPDIKTKTAFYAANIIDAAKRGASAVKRLSIFTSG